MISCKQGAAAYRISDKVSLLARSKTCSKCGQSKGIEEIARDPYKKDGLRSRCKTCHNEANRERRTANQAKYRQKDIDSRAKVFKSWELTERIVCTQCGQEKDRDQFFKGKWRCKACSIWPSRNKGHRAKVREADRKRKGIITSPKPIFVPKCVVCSYCQFNGKKTAEQCAAWQWRHFKKSIASDGWRQAYEEVKRRIAISIEVKRQKDRYWNDPKYHINRRMKNFIGKNLNGTKNGQQWQELVGWTIDELMAHLQKRFKKGMGFENYGEWHIDHKIPLAVFNYSKPTDIDFQRAWSLTNLQPMWGKENIAKSDKLTRPFQPCLSL